MLNTDPSAGLTDDEVRKRRAMEGENRIYARARQPIGHYLGHILTDYTSIIMLAMLLIAAIFDETENLIIMISIMVLYYIIIIASYLKSESILSNISSQSLPTAKVLRNGKLFIVRQKDLVRGDVIYISTGDIIPADCRLCESDGLEILEAGLTGIMTATRKDARFVDFHTLPPTEQKNMVFATTIVTKGTGRAIVTGTGEDTLVRHLNRNNTIETNEQASIFEAINSFCRKWTICMTVGVFLLTIIDVLLGYTENGIFGSFMLGISAAVASMSEFYTAFAYISLACGIYAAVNRRREINRGALIKGTAQIEKIKDLDCLIVPKDAAFCVSDVELNAVYANDDVFTPDSYGYKNNAGRVLRYALLSTGIYGSDLLQKKNRDRDNVYTGEEEVIIRAAEKSGEYNVSLEQKYPLLQHLSSGVDSKFDTSLVAYGNGYVVAMRGEYAKVLPLCSSYCENGRIYEMTTEKMSELLSMCEKLSRESNQVLAVVSKDTIYNNLRRLSACQTEMTLEGLLIIKESIIPEVAKNILRCRNANIQVIMLADTDSENNIGTAESLGIIGSRDEMMTGAGLNELDEGVFRADLDKYKLYTGLSLQQKRNLVRYLRESGKKVGYLCSELDEIILMRESDIGFSHRLTISDKALTSVELTGKSIPINARNSSQTKGAGCEALKFVADVIVSDPNEDGTGGFNAIVQSLLCSKAIYANMRRMIRYMLTSQIAKLLIVFVSVFSPLTVCTPPQILFCGLIIDFLSLIIIAFEKPNGKMLETDTDIEALTKPLRKNIVSAVFGVIWAGLTVLVLYLMYSYKVVGAAQLPGCFFLTFILSQLTVLAEYKLESGFFGGEIKLNGAHVLLVLAIAAFIFAMFYFPSFGILFGVVSLPYAAVAGIVLCPIVIFAACELGREIFKK